MDKTEVTIFCFAPKGESVDDRANRIRQYEDFFNVSGMFGEDAPWCAAGIGSHQATLNDWAIAAGGHARTGLEDNVRLDRDTLAPSNAALVRRAVKICERHHRPVATWKQARDILRLKELVT